MIYKNEVCEIQMTVGRWNRAASAFLSKEEIDFRRGRGRGRRGRGRGRRESPQGKREEDFQLPSRFLLDRMRIEDKSGVVRSKYVIEVCTLSESWARRARRRTTRRPTSTPRHLADSASSCVPCRADFRLPDTT